MCNFFSAVLTKDEVFYSDPSRDVDGETDSHGAIIRGNNQKHQPLHADGSKGPDVLRTECKPSVRTKRLEDFDSYDFVIDQDVYPSWYDKADAEARTRAALRERFPKGSKVTRTGSLTIPVKSKIVCKYLTSVGGSLYVSADADLPALTSVGGYLDVSADADLPALTSVGGSLDVRADADLPALTSVGGSLYVRADADLPALTSVGGSLYVSADADLPALTSVGGSLYVSAGKNLIAPRPKR